MFSNRGIFMTEEEKILRDLIKKAVVEARKINEGARIAPSEVA